MLGRGDVRPGDREKGFDSSVMQTEELILDPMYAFCIFLPATASLNLYIMLV